MLDLYLKSTSFLEKFKGIYIMSLVDKDTNALDDKKEVVVTIPLLEKKLSTTEKVTKSDEVHKRTENITTGEEVVNFIPKTTRSGIVQSLTLVGYSSVLTKSI